MSKAIERIIEKMQTETKEAERRRGQVSPNLRDEVRQSHLDAIDQDLAGQLKSLRDEGLELVAEERRAAEVDRYKARQVAGPQSAQEWGQAAARSQFIAADVAGMGPEDAIRAYKLAHEAGDRVGAWLLARHALPHLDGMTADPTTSRGPRARHARRELQELVGGEVEAEYNTTVARLDDLERVLKEPRGRQEEDTYTEGIRRRFGIN